MHNQNSTLKSDTNFSPTTLKHSARNTGTVSRFPLWIASALLLACAPSPTWHADFPQTEAIDAATLARDLAWLSAVEREGRGIDTQGLDAAAEYIATEFRNAGLEPTDGKSYFQNFETVSAIEIASVKLCVHHREARTQNFTSADCLFERGKDFEPFLHSASGALTSEIVFAGYGISAPEIEYDDYGKLALEELKGKWVLVLDDLPPAARDQLKKSRRARYQSRRYKISNAKQHGAAGILFTASRPQTNQEPPTTEPNWVTLVAESNRTAKNPLQTADPILTLAVSRNFSERIWATQSQSLSDAQVRIQESGKPQSHTLENVKVFAEILIVRKPKSVRNVVGILRGSDPELSREAVVVGAHYDHLGHGEFASLAPQRLGEVHPGADDNASGTAGLLALARSLRAAALETPLRHSVIFVAFTGEELGLLGSTHFVENPVHELRAIRAMLNMDMIGRLEKKPLIVFGTDSSPDFPALVQAAAKDFPIEVELSGGTFGPSDQLSFYTKEIPVLFFFTGSHAEYHTPDDVFEKLDLFGTRETLRLVHRIAYTLANTEKRPTLAKLTEKPKTTTGSPGYGPYLGTVPSFAPTKEPGIVLQAIRPNSPAALAGLQAGDRIVEFDREAVTSLEDFSMLLYASEPGQRVEIVVVRGQERIRVQAVLGQRR